MTDPIFQTLRELLQKIEHWGLTHNIYFQKTLYPKHVFRVQSHSTQRHLVEAYIAELRADLLFLEESVRTSNTPSHEIAQRIFKKAHHLVHWIQLYNTPNAPYDPIQALIQRLEVQNRTLFDYFCEGDLLQK